MATYRGVRATTRKVCRQCGTTIDGRECAEHPRAGLEEEPDSLGETTVTVDGKPLPLRLDLANHSPTGFEWGYGGSGPAQLALAILAHHFRQPHEATQHLSLAGDHEHVSKGRGGTVTFSAKAADQLALRLHQSFKWKTVARFEKPEWTLTTEKIRAALGPVTLEEALDDPQGFVESMEEK